MQTIDAVIKPNDSGAHVVNLIECLLLFVERGIFKTYSAPDQPTGEELAQLAASAKQDRETQFFGDAVRLLVRTFQVQQGLGDQLAGVVEKRTASRMNEVLLGLGIELGNADYEVAGVVMDATGRRVAGLDMRAFDRDVQRETVLGRASTDGAGAYRIVFPASLFRATAAERGGPDLIVRACDEHGLLLAQSAMVRSAGPRTELNLTIDADARVVSGTVSDDAGKPLAGLRVQVVDRDLRSEETLGEATTDAAGHYQVRYTAAQFRRAEKAGADVRVRVFNGARELAVSDTLFNAAPRVVVDLTIAAALLHTDSEWERLLRELAPLLENVGLHELTGDNLSFLAGETGIDPTHLQMARCDAQWRAQYPEHKLAPAVFFGLLRQGLPDQRSLLLQAGSARLREALKLAVAGRQAPAALAHDIDAIVAMLAELAIDDAFVAGSGDDSAPRIGVLLAASDVKPGVQRQIAGVMLAQAPGDDPQQLWQALAQAGVPDDAVRSTRFALEAHELLYQHVPTLAVLQASQARGYGAGADLARLDRPQWLEVARAAPLAPGFDSAEAYGGALADGVELAFPTAVVAHRLVHDARPARRDVGQLLIQNPQFDLLTGALEQFMSKAELGQIGTPRAALATQLATEMRVARMAPASGRALHMQALQEQGFDSATKVMLAGEVAFMGRMDKACGAVAAQQIYINAGQRAADVTLHALQLHELLAWPFPVLPHAPVAPDSRLADWVALFGSAGRCGCPPCASVHGPAAYLMDLLQYLKGMAARSGAGAAHAPSLYDRLDARRPDLKHLKLNCANAETPLPYIDLVIELLERQIGGTEAGAAAFPQTPEDADAAMRLRALPAGQSAFDGLYREGGALHGARYPWSLPFERDLLHTEIVLGLIGALPAELLTLPVASGAALPRAQLGLGPACWTLLSDTAPERVAEGWGLTGLDALLRIGGETGLLARSGLAVDALFALLASPLFERWELAIDRGADPCTIDLARLTLRGGGVPDLATQHAVFGLLQRVLRLRLALNWPLARLQTVLQALQVADAAASIDLFALARLVTLARQLEVPADQLAERMLALDRDAPLAADAWLAMLKLSPADHGHLVAVGLADSLALLAPAQRLQQLDEALRSLALVRAAAIDPAELHYLLLDADLVPAVFMPRPEVLERQLSRLIDAIADASAALADDAAPADVAARRRAAALDQLARITGASFVAEVVAAALPAVALLDGALALFEALATGAAGVERRAGEVALVRVVKTCRLLDLLRFTPADVLALGQLKGAGHSLFDFDAIPALGESEAAGPADLEPLLWASVTQASLPGADRRLLHVIASAVGAEQACADFDAISGAGASLVLAHALDLVPSEAALWRAPQTYARLLAATRWLQQRRLPHQALATLLDGARLNPGALAPLRELARGRFASDALWYQALTPAMDRLRARQRDALLAHLLHTNGHGWKSADDVYAALLIDVQMGPCQLSSRIVHAHGAVQLFVQRCLMNLETAAGIALGDVSDIAQWRQWTWMKHYRVWEAGREVFLYPENWIEPELRDVKSPFFGALENALLQEEISVASVERSMRAYLTSLHEVARLDVCALYREVTFDEAGAGKPPQRSVIHMVGRTHAVPHAHFYRKRLDDQSWTPWEKIDLTIDADNLALVVHNGRPALFWTQFKEVQFGRTEPVILNWKISLAWSVRDSAGWQAPRTGAASLTTFHVDKSAFVLRPVQQDNVLALRIYSNFLVARVAPFALNEFRLDVCVGDLVSVPAPAPAASMNLPAGSVMWNNKLLFNGDAPSALFLSTEVGTRHRYGPEGAVAILNRAGPAHTLLPALQYGAVRAYQPFVFADSERQFLATHEYADSSARGTGRIGSTLRRNWYRFSTLYHPYACLMLKAVDQGGLDALYRAPEPRAGASVYEGEAPPAFARQLISEASTVFGARYAPTTVVRRDWTRAPFLYPFEEFDFTHGGAYALYNWEVFFHAPLLLADRLSKSGRFAEAQQQFHVIFDPTDVSQHGSPHKFWRVKPLFVEAQRWSGGGAVESLEAMLRRLAEGAADLDDQVAAWRDDPFNAHLIARTRLIAYMKTVVQKYITNLIDWGDSVFRLDTMEAINEATQLYVLASEILGPPPTQLPPLARPARSYDELMQAGSVDAFSNVLVDIETSLPLADRPGRRGRPAAPGVGMLSFCIPANARLQALRTTIADRLFKLRHCRDIEGRVRQLALFAPPIDPALLVRARAAGLDIGTALSMALGTRPPHYRFQPLLQKALEFCGEVRAFGGALLGALEKQDGEQLSQLRARHEVGILKLASQVRQQQVAEAEVNLAAVKRSRALVQARRDFYDNNLVNGLSSSEAAQISHLHHAHAMEMVSGAHSAIASVLHMLPVSVIGFPNNGVEWGGPNLGAATQAAGAVFGMLAQQWTFEAAMAGYNATYARRADDWRQQLASADLELAQIEQQIAAADIRLHIAQQEQENHEQQLANAEQAQAALRDKFTNAQLYGWMSAQLAALHFQFYRMAFDLAKQAEAAAGRELGMAGNFIGFDHVDGGRKGLLAGELLGRDLRRLELAYMQHNTRLFEITTNISLRRLDPLALWSLRVHGACGFDVTPALFDMDFPGHRGRRIKSVSVSVPGVVGPYGGVNGILACQAQGQRIATSSGQSDAGVFQPDLRDERYLPFEGIDLDLVTHWDFTLPAVLRPFDYDTIGDLLLHVQYTVRDTDAPAVPPAPPPGPLRLLVSVRHDFPAESRQLREGHAPDGLTVVLADRLFPYFARRRVNIIGIQKLSSGAPPQAVTPVAPDGLPLGGADADAYFAIEYAL